MRLIGLVPAAGSGSRMTGAGRDPARPKQLQPLGDRTMLEHAVDALLADPRLAQVLVVVAPGTAEATRAAAPRLHGARVVLADVGGATRAASVRGGLAYLLSHGVGADDRVLVHDAARPCLGADDLARLVTDCAADAVGGLLAVPLADTLKQADDAAQPGGPPRVAATLDRSRLWRAQTPQLFPVGLLAEALDRAGARVTDEASAIEHVGLRPRLVAGSDTNLKVTRPSDWVLAEAILRSQGRWT